MGGFIHSVGLSRPYARQIVERAIADDPAAAPADIEAKARLDADRADMTNINDLIAKAVTALRAAGHWVEAVSRATNVYRVDDGDAITGPVVLALAIRLGLMHASSRSG